jgi:hypothetical protein
MYRKMAEEEDKKVAERWQKDADGILIFVSPLAYLPPSFHISTQNYRPGCSLLQLQH